MKMTSLEKCFVNSATHSQRVAAKAVRRLRQLPYRSGQKYLDVGCGNGVASLRVAIDCGLNVVGIDVDPAQIELARTAAAGVSGVRYITGDATRLPFGDCEFDFIATNNTTHHIPNWQSALAEMIRVLKPGGYLLYADLVLPQWLVDFLRFFARERAGLPTKAALRRLAQNGKLRQLSWHRSGLACQAAWQSMANRSCRV